MDIVFYIFDEGCTRQTQSTLPEGCSLSRWQPRVRQLVPPGANELKWLVWAAFHYAGIFETADYGVFTISDGWRIVHRSVVFPKYWRFPFMRPSDLQVGDTWTLPAARRRGLAAVALQAAVDLARSKNTRLWYLTTKSNGPSIAVAERAGLRCAGRGVRGSRFGVRALGTFELTAPS